MQQPDHANPMPEKRRDTEIVLRVMHRHGVTPGELADATGLSESYISRMLSGQYPIHLHAAVWLHAQTQDHELRRYLLGGADHVIVPMPAAESVDVATLTVPLARDLGEMNTAAAIAVHDRSASHARRISEAAHRVAASALRFERATTRRLEVTG
ncbi:MAG: helix-turn-helix transcriptional regulator [Phycisphaerales bacterium]|nr:helix-turn-helix transcriptional regulator [Phycisphaerales bacterium]